MFDNYRKFLQDFDNLLSYLFETQKKYIKCKKGCTGCCSKGDYPFSHLEFSYLTEGYINLPETTKILVQQNIRQLLLDKKEFKGERFEHVCPFLINGECCVYDYRGIICRTFGICYYDDKEGYVRLPECVNNDLNYSEYFDKENNILNIADVPKINLRIDRVLNSELAKQYKLESGEILPMLEWLNAPEK